MVITRFDIENKSHYLRCSYSLHYIHFSSFSSLVNTMILVQFTMTYLVLLSIHGLHEFIKMKAVAKLTSVVAIGRNFSKTTAWLTCIISLSQYEKDPVNLNTWNSIPLKKLVCLTQGQRWKLQRQVQRWNFIIAPDMFLATS